MDTDLAFSRRIVDFFREASKGRAGAFKPARLMEAAFFQRGQAERRRRAIRAAASRGEDLAVPPILIASLTRRCNLDCEGCYSKALRPGAAPELSDARFLELFREALELGAGAILLAGGEPMLRRSLVEEASRLKGVLLPMFTNGTLMDESFLDLASGSSLVPILSIEGDVSETDGRRGPGIHGRALDLMESMRRRGMLFGASVTLSSRNADLVLSRDWLEGLAATGASVLFLVEFVPVANGTEDLVLTPGQKARLESRDAFAGLPYPVVALPGDESEFGGCLAAGRGFVHLAADGALEACPFAPFSDTNAGEVGLRAALASPLMAALRKRHSELTETSGGCALWNKAGWVASLSACAAAPRGSGLRTQEAVTA